LDACYHRDARTFCASAHSLSLRSRARLSFLINGDGDDRAEDGRALDVARRCAEGGVRWLEGAVAGAAASEGLLLTSSLSVTTRPSPSKLEWLSLLRPFVLGKVQNDVCLGRYDIARILVEYVDDGLLATCHPQGQEEKQGVET